MFSPPGLRLPMPMVIGITTSLFGAWTSSYAESAAAPAAQTGIAANQAIYCPFVVTETTLWTRGWWYNGSTPANQGNVCVAIYDEAGTRLATTGAVAAAGASVIQDAAFAASVTLTPGVYYVGYSPSASGVTAVTAYPGSFQRGALAGLYTQATGGHPLPATATYATWSSQVLPLFGITRTSFAI